MRIEIHHIFFTYRSILAPPHEALRDVSLSVEPGERLAIVGSSGSGKSTLVQHLNGLNKPESGHILFNGEDLQKKKGGSKARDLRKRVGLVFQFPEIQLFEETVFQDVSYGPKNMGMSESEIEQHVFSALAAVGLDDEAYRKRSPFQLSGGERRRVALAGILAMDPEVLVLDEPTVGLDRRASDQVEKIVQSYSAKQKTVIFVSHNMEFVARVAERIVVMHQGRIIFDGPKNDLFGQVSVLNQAGLLMPQISLCLRRLAKMGLDIRTDVYTLEEAETEIWKAARKISG